MFNSNITNNNNNTEIITTPTIHINLTTTTENITINNNNSINQSIITFNSTHNSKTSDFINNSNSAINSSCNNNSNQINRLNMAECALIKSSQCFQDKNRIKKDLTKLTKNLLLLVGLERVAQELVGGRRWRKLTAPFNSLEPDEIQDWSPPEICYFCNSDKHDSNHNEIFKQHSDDCPLSSSTTSSSTTGIESSQSQSTNQQHQPPTSCSCLHIPNGSDINKIPNINVPINIPVVLASSAAIKTVTAMSNVITTSEQPLDLSLHSRSVLMTSEIDKLTSNHASDTSTCSSLLRIPHLNQINTKQGKKNRLETTSTTTPSTTTSSNWKRAYTEEELQQALNDIQSGKLGTRRAAVIYGIPRSTLRNKVYKLSSERVNAKRGQGSLTSSAAGATVAVTAASTNVARGSAFNSANSLSVSLPACAAVSAAAAAAAAAAHTPNVLNSVSSSTNLSGPVNFLSGRKSIEPLRNNSSNKEGSSSRIKSMPSKRLLKHQPVLNDETEKSFESVLSSSPNVPKTSDNYDNDIEDEDLNDLMANNNSLIKNDLKQFLKRTLTQKAANIKPSLSSRNDTILSNAADANNNDNKPDSDINTGPTNTSTMPNIITDTLQVLSSMDCGNAIGPLISQILLSVHAFPLANSVNNLINSNVNHNFNKPTENMDLDNSISGTLPLIPELIHKLAQERLEVERLSSSGTNEDQSITNESSDRNVILKVPSYQPKMNIDVGHSKEDLSKTIIKQEGPLSNHSDAVPSIINYCGVSNPSSHSFADSNMIKDENNNSGVNDKRYKSFPVNSDESSLDALINENAKSYNSSRRKGEKRNPIPTTNSNKTSDQSAPSTPDPKRNRPKRGRYRNYKRDDLAKAVKAVQNGEMSVHRAGTHFGVPHSTLEYKVKERHLLRPKKRQTTSTSGSATSLIKKDDGQSLILPKTNLTSDTLLNHPKSSSLLTQQEPQTQIHTQTQQQQSLEGLPMMNQASLWQSALPLFPFDFGSNQNSTNFFASNMMRKLKENAQLHEENFNASSNGSTNTNNNNNNSISTISDSNQMGTTTGLKDREFGSLLLETLIKSSLERKMLNSMSNNTNNDNESRLNRNTPSTIPYRFHNED